MLEAPRTRSFIYSRKIAHTVLAMKPVSTYAQPWVGVACNGVGE